MGSHFEMKSELKLREDQKYKCIDNLQKHTRFISVRPTKSCVRALREYFMNMSKNLPIQNIKVEVVDDKGFGRLLFPKNSDFQPHVDTRPPSVFEFTIDRDQRYFSKGYQRHQGAIEIIKQESQNNVESIGRIHYKARVKASDDVFAATKTRMEEAEKLHRKKCAKIIPDTSMIKSRYPQSRLAAMPDLVSGHVTKTSPAHLKQEKEQLAQKSTGDKPLKERPLKERLIHLLALGKTLGTDIKRRIQTEGTKQGEMSAFLHILRDVSNARDGKLHLKRNCWKQVNLNWPFYTDEEKIQVEKNKPPATPSPPSDGSGSSSSKSGKTPNSMQAGSPAEITGPQKREPTTHLNSNPIKKAKVQDKPSVTTSRHILTLSEKLEALKAVTKDIANLKLSIDQTTEKILLPDWPEVPEWPQVMPEITNSEEHVKWYEIITKFMPSYSIIYDWTAAEKSVLSNIRNMKNIKQNTLLGEFLTEVALTLQIRQKFFENLHKNVQTINLRLDDYYNKNNGKYVMEY
ncbi:RNA polymerase II elongation factor ELL2-like [Trichogramma pretiosum]|uniref:RNA polymerase II elongation factor ELL2-like n=1 Tax=Trichogramma pretiosum TaxID=7493 RepID=UPI000C718DC8|nr:RNA polymerase II elongation factor ELL2-like [Trichogramma pretiosum]